MHDSDNLDRLLDSALETYGESPSGLQERVLRRIAAEGDAAAPRRSRTWFWWAIPFPVAACILLIVMMHSPHQPREIRSDVNSTTFPSVDRQRSTSASVAGAMAPSLRRARRSMQQPALHSGPKLQAAALPKRDLFPSIPPLTSEEGAIIHLMSQGSEATRKSLLDAQTQADEPLNIAAIHVEPVEMPDVATH